MARLGFAVGALSAELLALGRVLAAALAAALGFSAAC
jgi:hypothetical protein